MNGLTGPALHNYKLDMWLRDEYPNDRVREYMEYKCHKYGMYEYDYEEIRPASPSDLKWLDEIKLPVGPDEEEVVSDESDDAEEDVEPTNN